MAISWFGSNRAAGWLGRKRAVEAFERMADLCQDIAYNLDIHNDVLAEQIFSRFCSSMASAVKLPPFEEASCTPYRSRARG